MSFDVPEFEECDPEECRVEGRTGVERREYVRRFQARVRRLGRHFQQLWDERPDLHVGERHPADPEARVVAWEPKQVRHTERFDIEVRYLAAAAEDPLAEPARINWSDTEIMRARFRDAEGRPLVNTAGSLLLDIEEPVSILIANVRKNVGAIPLWVNQLRNAVNTSAFVLDGMPIPPRCALLKKLSIGEAQRTAEDLPWREISFEIHVFEESWDRFFWNRGKHELVEEGLRLPGGGVKKVRRLRPILGDDGQIVEEPVFLDLNGERPHETLRHYVSWQDKNNRRRRQLIKTRVIKNPLDPEDLVVLHFRLKKEFPFEALPFQ